MKSEQNEDQNMIEKKIQIESRVENNECKSKNFSDKTNKGIRKGE